MIGTTGERSALQTSQASTTDAETQPVLEVSHLGVAYGDETAVEDLSFAVGRGEFVALLGPSGCGKTTTLRAIAGLERASSGQISIDGRTVASSSVHVAPEKRPLNMVFQSYAIWPHMTVFQNVAYGLQARRASGDIRERVMQALESVGLARFAKRPGTDLSGGQQQRVALARALVTKPAIMLYDEPLSNLDTALRRQVRGEIADLHRQFNTSTVYVTHDQSEALSMADRVVVMKDGVAAQVDTPHAVYNRPSSRFVAEFVGPINSRPAEIVTNADGVAEARILNGNEGLRLTLRSDFRTFRAGETGEIALRPEHFTVVDASARRTTPDGNVWSGRVVRSEFLGSRTECRVRLGEWVILIELPGNQTVEAGDEIHLYIDPSRPIWLPAGERETAEKTRP